MKIEISERCEQLLQLRKTVFEAEQERLMGKETLSLEEAKKKLKESHEEYLEN